MRDLTGDKSRAAPSLSDRTWPDRDLHLCAPSGYQALVRNAVNFHLNLKIICHNSTGTKYEGIQNIGLAASRRRGISDFIG